MKEKENLFWLVKWTGLWADEYVLFNHIPHKESCGISEYSDDYKDGLVWTSSHGCAWVNRENVYKFSDITCDDKPIASRLVQTNDNVPDFYVERRGDNLFICGFTYRYHKWKRRTDFWRHFRKWQRLDFEKVPGNFQISNKLFPWLTEKSGICRFNVEII